MESLNDLQPAAATWIKVQISLHSASKVQTLLQKFPLTIEYRWAGFARLRLRVASTNRYSKHPSWWTGQRDRTA